MRLQILGLSVAVILGSTGCKTVTDVRPLLDAAIASYEQSRVLDQRAIDRDSARQERLIVRTFDQVEAATIVSLNTLLRSGWDSVNGDFKEDSHWRSWFGGREEIAEDAKQMQHARLKIYLGYFFQYQVSSTSGALQQQTIPAWDLHYSYGGDPSGITGITTDGASQLRDEYEQWLPDFDQTVLRQAPIYLDVRDARAQIEVTTRNEVARRRDRSERLHSNLIEVARLARNQASTLTDNAGFISLANGIARLGNQLLGGQLEDSDESQEEADQ